MRLQQQFQSQRNHKCNQLRVIIARPHSSGILGLAHHYCHCCRYCDCHHCRYHRYHHDHEHYENRRYFFPASWGWHTMITVAIIIMRIIIMILKYIATVIVITMLVVILLFIYKWSWLSDITELYVLGHDWETTVDADCQNDRRDQ